MDCEKKEWISVSSLSRFNKKYERNEEKGGERKCWILVMWIPKFLYPVPADLVWSVRGVPKVKRKKNLWQTNCGNAIAEIGKKNCNNCGNDIAENGGKKKVVSKSGEE